MKFSKKVLKNGLRVVTIPMKDNPTVTVLVLVEAGSKYETKRVNGISHFLEHMCFKGTVKRPKAIDISKELDALGSQYNAFTAQEYTGYYAKSDAKHFRQILDIVSDIYLNSTFPKAEMQKEKGVIIEEINMYEDMPQRHVQDLIMRLLYGNQPAGWNVTGEKKNILNMRRDDFVRYKANHYLPEATVIIITGQITPKAALQGVSKIFKSVKRGRKSKKKKHSNEAPGADQIQADRPDAFYSRRTNLRFIQQKKSDAFGLGGNFRWRHEFAPLPKITGGNGSGILCSCLRRRLYRSWFFSNFRRGGQRAY